MTQYKGLYIDHIFFNTKADIDSYLKTKAVEAYKMAVRYFANHPSMEASIYADEKATNLVTAHGFSWGEVEEIEISVLKEI